MKILKIKTECYFSINGRDVKPGDLSKNDLLELFNDIYALDDIKSLIIPGDDEIDKIKNPVEKEIVSQIIQKIQEFKDNLEQIKQNIESSFPSLKTE